MVFCIPPKPSDNSLFEELLARRVPPHGDNSLSELLLARRVRSLWCQQPIRGVTAMLTTAYQMDTLAFLPS